MVNDNMDSALGVLRRIASKIAPSESFTDVNSNGGNLMVALLVLTIYLVLLLLVTKWLWNNVLCKVVTVVKPLPDIFTTLGLVIVLSLVLPR